MSLRSTWKKLKKKTVRTAKFSAKPFTEPLRLAKKYPKETLALTAATFTGGTSLALTAGALGLDAAAKKSKKVASLRSLLSESGTGVGAEPIGETYAPAPELEAPPEPGLAPGFDNKTLLLAGGAVLAVLVLR